MTKNEFSHHSIESKMKILAIGDPHFKINNVVETDLMARKIFQLIEDRKPDFVVVLGDVLDRHESIHVNPLTRATSFLKGIAQRAPIYVLIGNHDRPNNSTFLTDVHPFVALNEWVNTVIIDKTKDVTIGEHLFSFVPYVPPGRFLEALGSSERENWKSARVIFAHQEFKGAKMGAVISTEGDSWEMDWPLVISGHIHDYDHLQENIYYAGTPIQHAFGDRDDKTVLWIDVKDEITVQRVDLELPRKILVYLTPEQIASWEPDLTQQIKIVLRGPTSILSQIMRSEKIKRWIERGVKVVRQDMPDDRPVSLVQPQKFSQMLSDHCHKMGLTWLLEEILRS